MFYGYQCEGRPLEQGIPLGVIGYDEVRGVALTVLNCLEYPQQPIWFSLVDGLQWVEEGAWRAAGGRSFVEGQSEQLNQPLGTLKRDPHGDVRHRHATVPEPMEPSPTVVPASPTRFTAVDHVVLTDYRS